MSNYTKSTNFATKDNLSPGDPLKIVRGTEIDTEFNNISTAISTKTDNSAAAITGGAIDGATVGATTPATGSFTTLAASGTTTLAGALVGAVTQAAFNTVSTTLNLGGAATALNLGAATGTATVNNTTLAAKAITASTTLAVTGTSTLTGAVTATAGVTGPITSSSVSITGGSITGITDLAVADGGTGASTAAGGLNNLLPSQTGNSSKYLQTDGTNASWDAVSLSTADITGTLGAANGGTGVSNNAAMTVTGSGNFAYTRTLTGTTNVTFPTTGTLATLAGTETLTNKTLTSPILTTPTLGVATGTSFQGIIGNVTPAAGNFTTLGASSTATLNTLSSSGATLTGGTINGMTVGATTASTGAFTTVTASTAIGTTSGGTGLSSFTSGGVVYASSTSALATGSALTFDGTNLSLSTGGLYLPYDQALYFKNLSGTNRQILAYANNTYLDGADGSIIFRTGTSPSEGLRLTSSSLYTASGINVGFGTSSPSQKLHLNVASGSVYEQISSGSNNVYVGFDSARTVGAIQSNNALTFDVGSSYTQRMVIDTSGNLGLGVTPSAFGSAFKAIQIFSQAPLALVSSGDDSSFATNAYVDNTGTWFFTSTSSYKPARYTQFLGQHQWHTATASGTAGNTISFTQAMTLDASGNLQLGTTSNPDTARLHVSKASGEVARFSSPNGTNSYITLGRNDATGEGMTLGYSSSTGDCTISTITTHPLIFRTNNTERARIDSSGNLLVGKTNSTGVNAGVVLTPTGGFTLTKTGTSASDQVIFYRGTAGSEVYVGTITTTGTATSYVTSSDYRLKNSVAPMTDALAKVAQLKPVTYKWNADGSDGEGFIAHELAEVVPQCVTGEKDAVDADGNPKYQGIDTSFLVATLTAAIQELKAEFDAYKASHP